MARAAALAGGVRWQARVAVERSGWGEGTTVKTMAGITLVAVGAILTFAVNAHPGFISPQVAGLVLMLTGITGLCLNQRGTGLLDRQLAILSAALIGATPPAPPARGSHRNFRRLARSPLMTPRHRPTSGAPAGFPKTSALAGRLSSDQHPCG
jgi:hypothetical protein